MELSAASEPATRDDESVDRVSAMPALVDFALFENETVNLTETQLHWGRPLGHRILRAICTVVTMVLLVAGCDSGSRDPFAAIPELVITAREYSFEMLETAEGGLVQVTLDNQGTETHQVELVRILGDANSSDVFGAISRMDVNTLNSIVTYHGGPNEVPPGETRSVVTDLEAGTYVLLCFVSTNGGALHVLKGMIGTMEITTPSEPADWTEPEPDVRVTMDDYRFDVVGELSTGQNLVLVENAGDEPHEWRVDQGAEPGGGSSTISPGSRTWVALPAETGTYTFFCFVPSADGSGLHINRGMSGSVDVP